MFYLVEITNGTEKAIYQYDTRDAAVATFHQKLGNQMKAESCTSELLIVVTAEGSVVANTFWQKAE